MMTVLVMVQLGLTMKWNGNINDNGSKLNVMDGTDNISASSIDVTWNEILLSINDLSYINGLKPDNETYLCGESYWTGVEHDVSGCNFRNRQLLIT